MSQPDENSFDSVPRELYRLMSAWADGVLTNEEFAQLDELLKQSVEGRRAFATYVRLCQSLPEMVVPAFELPLSDRDAAATTMIRADQFDAKRRKNSATELLQKGQLLLSRLTRRPWLISACLIVCVLAGVSTVYWPKNSVDVDRIATVPVISSSPSGLGEGEIARLVSAEGDSHLAVVTQSEQVVWGPDAASVDIGAALGSQVLRIVSGTLDLEFACGATVRLRGPVEFALVSKSRGKLTFGGLSAQVPPRAHGFAIDTPSVEVVDLGTEFGVNVDRSGTSDVHVFRGLVETRMSSGDERPGLLERLSVDQTRRFVSNQAKSQILKYDGASYPVPPERYHDEPSTHGAICLLREPPKSLAVGALESNEFILLFEERKSVLLHRPIPVSLSLPGRYDRFRGKDGKLRPQQRVDSYLLHFDALTTPQNYSHLRLDGSVTFPKPILGVLAVGQLLTLTDPLFGDPDVVQSEARSRGLDRNAKGNNLDVVTLSEDRRTLHVSFSVGGSCDQLRILIAAE